jgi:NTP pyrophosphatase (non-canonical NTP hydrolase)
MTMDLQGMIKDCVDDSGRWFPGAAQDLPNLVLCMAGEVGEVANLVKKIVRGSITLEDARDQGLEEEIVDVLIYLCNLMGAKEFANVNWERIWVEKRKFNEQRFGRFENGLDMGVKG